MYVLTLLCCVMYASTRAVHFAVRYFKTYCDMYCNIFTDLSSYLIYFSFLIWCRKNFDEKDTPDVEYVRHDIKHFCSAGGLKIMSLILLNVSAILYKVFNLEPEQKF